MLSRISASSVRPLGAHPVREFLAFQDEGAAIRSSIRSTGPNTMFDASVEWWARRQRCSLRCGGLGVRTQPLPLPRADRPAAALVPSTSHGAARIMIELRNKHALTGKLCCFQIVLCAQLGGDFLSQSLI